MKTPLTLIPLAAILLPLVLTGLAAAAVAGLAWAFGPKKKRAQRPFVTVQRTFPSEAAAREYFLANAERIANEASPAELDSTLAAFVALGLEHTPHYELIAQAAARANPLIDPFA